MLQTLFLSIFVLIASARFFLLIFNLLISDEKIINFVSNSKIKAYGCFVGQGYYALFVISSILML